MKFFAISTLFAGLSAFGTQAQDAYDLVYDYTDGSLTMITTGDITAYQLETTQLSGPITPGNHQLFVSLEEIAPGFIFQTGISFVTPYVVSEAMNPNSRDAGLTIAPGSYNIGNLLPANLSEQTFYNLFDKKREYATDGSGDRTDFDLVYVPEPASFVLLSAGAVMVIRRRRV